MSIFHLDEIVTKDKIIHQGVYIEPAVKKDIGIIWVHGLTSNFYSHIPLLEAFSKLSEVRGYGFSAFNTRGHDMIAGLRRLDNSTEKGYQHILGGAGYEIFEQCIYDIDAVIAYMFAKGYRKIILLGHSTGANKVCFYAGTKHTDNVVGVGLLSPASDRLDPARDPKTREWQLSMMEVYLADGKADQLFLDYYFFPLTPRRFLSLFRPNSTEDTFDYGDEKMRMTCFQSIKVPVLVVFGSKDEHIDRPVDTIMSAFLACRNDTSYQQKIIENALHSFNGHEEVLVSTVDEWIQSLKLI